VSRRFVLILFAAFACAQSPPPGVWALPSQQDPVEWTPLFNGKDLTGWAKVRNDNWTVENRAIHGQGMTKEGGYLQTEQKFKDFHLSLWFKCDSDGNSGVMFRTEFDSKGKLLHGLQFEIDKRPNYRTGGIYGAGRGFIVWPTAEHEVALRPDDWNHFLLKVVKNRYICFLNGWLMVDFTDPTPRSFDGNVAFQLHAGGDGNMWFKDIFVRDLSKR